MPCKFSTNSRVMHQRSFADNLVQKNKPSLKERLGKQRKALGLDETSEANTNGQKRILDNMIGLHETRLEREEVLGNSVLREKLGVKRRLGVKSEEERGVEMEGSLLGTRERLEFRNKAQLIHKDEEETKV